MRGTRRAYRWRIVVASLSMSVLALLSISAAGCHWLLPFEASAATSQSYKCSAQIYRPLAGGKEFTEEWQAYAWATSQAAAVSDCQSKINSYLWYYQAPGFSWNHRNLVAAAVLKKQAVDCPFTWDNKAVAAPTWGGPFGAEARWNYPSASQGYAYFSIVDNDGSTRTAEPQIANAYIDLAERGGLVDEGAYILDWRHVRISDVFIELSTPFQLGDLTVTSFYIQSIGGVVALGDLETGGPWYQVGSYRSKFFVYASGTKSGQTGVTSYCAANDGLFGLTVYQGPPNAFFTFSYTLSTVVLDRPMVVRLSLSLPQIPYQFKTHQPFVRLFDKEATSYPVDLVTDIAIDHDGNLDRVLWFKNFEMNDEKFLGEGNPLLGVPLPAGSNLITAVAYDSYGAYMSDTMRLTGVPNVPPVANGDSYTTDEDTQLVVAAPGVLGNDTDENDDALSAVLVAGPSKGTLTLSADGSFVYTPSANVNGSDTFTYLANDGTEGSAAATVTISVTPLNDAPLANGDTYSGKEDAILTVGAPGILGNDTDVDGDVLTAMLVTGPAHGALVLNASGSFTYTPATDWFGTDGFTYQATDGTAPSSDATVTIQIAELRPDQEIGEQIVPRIPGLGLNAGQSTSLLTKLNAAMNAYAAGQSVVACNLLASFINELEALVAANLISPADAQALIAKAMNVRGEIGCK